MSIIVKGCFDFLDGNTSSGAQKKQMVLLCKGADNIVFSLLRKPQNNAESELYSKTQKHLGKNFLKILSNFSQIFSIFL